MPQTVGRHGGAKGAVNAQLIICAAVGSFLRGESRQSAALARAIGDRKILIRYQSMPRWPLWCHTETLRPSWARHNMARTLVLTFLARRWHPASIMWRHVRTTAHGAWQALSTALITRPLVPGEVVRSTLNRVTAILNAAASMSGSAETLPEYVRAGLRRISYEVFDVEHMARGALWRHWGQRTVAERLEFVQRFTDLLERLYVDLVRQSRWVSVLHSSDAIEGAFARVKWKIGTLRLTVAIEYRLRLSDGRWKIVDVLLNGQSFIASCRQEFDQKIGASSYAAVVKEMPRWESLGFIGPGLTLAPTADTPKPGPPAGP